MEFHPSTFQNQTKLSMESATQPDGDNGRVELEDVNRNSYPLFEQTKPYFPDQIEDQALMGVSCTTQLSCVFFSKMNVKNVQNQIRYQVWKRSGQKYVIAPQSETDLIIILRSIYLQYSKNLPDHVKEQVSSLNQKAIEFSVSNILTEVQQHLGYEQDITTLPIPLEHAANLSNAGTKVLELKNFM